MPEKSTCVPPQAVGSGSVRNFKVSLARLVPKMETSSPRDATGTLEALTPVAAFTTPVGLKFGVCWPKSEVAPHAANAHRDRQIARSQLRECARRLLP